MKRLFFLMLCLVTMNLSAQEENEQQSPKQFVQKFFKAFHAQDTVALKNMATEDLKLQSVSINAEGKTILSTDDYSKFLKSIASIPSETKFEERLLDFKIEENGALATVSTPYEFYVNGNFSHCGVNNFTLVKLDENWKIVHLIDTRNKNCD